MSLKREEVILSKAKNPSIGLSLAESQPPR